MVNLNEEQVARIREIDGELEVKRTLLKRLNLKRDVDVSQIENQIVQLENEKNSIIN